MSSEPRSPEASPLEDHGHPAEGVASEPANQRGFFGRFFGALTGSDEAGAAASADAGASPLGLVNLRRMRVDDVTVPKAEVIAAPESISLDDLVALFREHGFSRIPVYEASLDAPLGIVHLKDLALKHGFGSDDAFDLKSMLRPLLYVPPSMSIGVLLHQMQQKRIHMALVIDEYGGVDGLVTIEDLIEQVLGEIEDEHDEAEVDPWHLEAPGQWLFQARTPLEDVEAETGLRFTRDDQEDDVDTLGGLVFMLTGRVPQTGEVVTDAAGVSFEVIDADPRRVKTVRLTAPTTDAAVARGDVAAGKAGTNGA